jgi:hypothetical protein
MSSPLIEPTARYTVDCLGPLSRPRSLLRYKPSLGRAEGAHGRAAGERSERSHYTPEHAVTLCSLSEPQGEVRPAPVIVPDVA